jgi:peptide/nickel transport system permease protein
VSRVPRLLGRRLTLVLGGVLTGVVVFMALGAPWLTAEDPNRVNAVQRLQAPGPGRGLGSDDLGRPLWSRVVYGARLSLTIGLSVMVGVTLVGSVLGLAAGFFPRVDRVVMRVMDGLMAFPDVLLAIGLMAVLGPRVSNVIVALVVVYTPRMARVVRSVALVTGETVYVDAARALGASDARLLWRHVLPNCLSPAVVQATFTFALAVLTEAALGFLGVGAPPQLASWGTIISEGRLLVREAPWLTIVPGLAIVVTVVGLNLTGDGLRDYLDPRQPAS